MILKKSLKISKITSKTSVAGTRVGAKVNGREVWYAARDFSLLPSAEAFASAFLVPAMKLRADLVLKDPLSPMWLKNAQEFMRIYQGWWGYRPIRILAPKKDTAGSMKGPKTAMLMSGGIDSFYTLLRGQFRPDRHIYIHGIDISLEQKQRMELVETMLKRVASSQGAEQLTIRTNLTGNPDFTKVEFNHSHGPALISVAHLQEDVGRFVISSTFSARHDIPYGNHYLTDPLMSSETLEVIHYDASVTRADKIEAMVNEPLLRENLRVCLNNMLDGINCSECEKCTRTMLALDALGKLGEFGTFRPRRPLTELVDSVRHVSIRAVTYYEDIIKLNPGHELRDNIEALIKRSKNSYKNKKGLARIIAKIRQQQLRPQHHRT